MASVPLRSTSVVAAPKDYSIPNAQQILLLSVRASFTDNGAAGDWLPALQVLDNNGNVLVTAADQGVKVTAGSDADVSWFPGVKHTAAAGGGTAVDWCYIVTAGAVPSTDIFGPGTTDTISTFATSNSALYTKVDSTHWSTPGIPQIFHIWYTASALSFTTTNGTVFPLLHPGSGVNIPLDTVPNAAVVGVRTATRGLTTANEVQTDFHLGWGGTDTHTWHAQIWMFNAVGTTSVN